MDPGEAAAFGIDPKSHPWCKRKEFEVFDENWETVMMFLRMQTQWNVTMGGYVGLKYEALQWMCSLYSVKDPRSILEGIQVMEAAALEALNKKNG